MSIDLTYFLIQTKTRNNNEKYINFFIIVVG